MKKETMTMFTEKLTQSLMIQEPEQFLDVKIATWIALINKGYRPKNWFILVSGTKITCHKMSTEIEKEESWVELTQLVEKRAKCLSGGEDYSYAEV
ncbi:hypothetical protein MZM54_02765 [[Brevibacterium] frigoritolerans]|nr:hypothetical protein [Peribacillus frigoritolerans]